MKIQFNRDGTSSCWSQMVSCFSFCTLIVNLLNLAHILNGWEFTPKILLELLTN